MKKQPTTNPTAVSGFNCERTRMCTGTLGSSTREGRPPHGNRTQIDRVIVLSCYVTKKMSEAVARTPHPAHRMGSCWENDDSGPQHKKLPSERSDREVFISEELGRPWGHCGAKLQVVAGSRRKMNSPRVFVCLSSCASVCLSLRRI